ncbi:hypothetical protein GOBAR_AA36551 [Gossypium barbadense]|uniref:Uncharacterized protein n=1 Tax=Gossypium barbadense TaxID=3634 RepID=A0A2P5VZ96_GOSBA|nr:hypothetical protein GOBAR_AA36551 [Gossypium barbadense]
MGEANKARHGCATWLCSTHAQDTREWDSSRARPDSQNSKNTSSPSKNIMPLSRRKKAAVPSSKRRRGPGSSSEELFQILRARPLTTGHFIDWAAVEQVQLADAIRALLSTDLWERFFAIIEPTYLELSGLVCAMSAPEFGVALVLYTDEFIEEEDMNVLPRNIHISPSLCWRDLAPLSSTYDLGRSKALALAPSLRYLHAILAHTLTGKRESTDIVNTYDAYYLWYMANAHMTDLAYFIAFTICYQT